MPLQSRIAPISNTLSLGDHDRMFLAIRWHDQEIRRLDGNGEPDNKGIAAACEVKY